MYLFTTQTHQQLVPRRSPDREDGRTARFKRILVAKVGEVRNDDDQVADLLLIPRLSYAMTRFIKP